MPFVLFCLGLYVRVAMAESYLEGYDCDRPLGIRTYSAREVEECVNHDIHVDKVERPGQVLKKLTGRTIEVKRCFITADITLANCGAYGHLEGIYPDFPRETEHVTATECSEIFATKEYNFRGQKVQVQIDAVTKKGVFLKGKVASEGDSCESGGSFSYEGYSAYDAVVPVFLIISLNSWSAQVDMTNGKIIINKLFQCDYSKGFCTDDTYGTVVWPLSSEICTPTQFSPLYTGTLLWFNASAVRGVVIESRDRVAVLRPVKEVQLCGLTVTTTTLDDIYITNEQYQISQQPITGDIFGYFETKLDYVYYKTGEVNNLNLQWISEAICKLEQQSIRLKLNMIAKAPPGELFTLGEQGIAYMASGEVIYQLICTPLDNIQFRDTEACFQDLPVYVPPKNAFNSSLVGNVFLQPISRILVATSPEIVCSRITPFAFKYHASWFIAHPARSAITEPAPFPLEFSPPKPATFVPLLPEDTIYSGKDIQELSRSLQFPKVREATVMSVVRRMNGMTTVADYDLTKSFTSASYDNIIGHYFAKVWGVLSAFGQAMSGILGIWIIVKFCSSLLSTLFNCSALYRVSGVSFKLLGSFFTTLTSYFLASASFPRENRSESAVRYEQVDQELSPVNAGSEHIVTITPNQETHEQTTVASIYPEVDRPQPSQTSTAQVTIRRLIE